MVEVFKTNVENAEQADLILRHIHGAFVEYSATFDLEDCDRVLRVKSSRGVVQASALIQLLRKLGFQAEVLPDQVPFGECLAPCRNQCYFSY